MLRSSANRTIFYRVLTSMEKLFITPKRKSSYRSDSEPSLEDKRLKESNLPAKISSDADRVMEVLEPKIDLVLSKLSNVEAKMEELNVAVKGLQSKVTSLEIEVDSVKTIQKALDDNFTSLERNTVFVDEQVQELTAKTYKNSNDVSDTRRKLLYLEAYSRRENLKFEGIPETFVTSEEDGAIQRGEASTENTKTQNLVINKQSIHSKKIKEAGFLKLGDIVANGFKLKRWDAFREKNLSLSDYLLLQGIFSVIPPDWKLPFKDGENSNNQTNETVSDDDVQDVTRMTSKLIYSTLVKRIQIPPTAQSKFDFLYNISGITDWKKYVSITGSSHS